ncbi:Gp138 family membrane-puncturing spike protein [Sporosarcina sp. FSL W7-1283]|uniref:Gp138 family membrane-puncturing spike protein n=1 Tax=Sporosarcina sp. FSL W7-1283 TaxID=2921560 RepID=UPI0030F57161
MSEAVGFFDGFAEGMMDGLRVAMQAEILKFDHVAMKADIQPLQGDLPPILDVPVSLHRAGAFFIRMPFKKGDKVIVVFNDYPLDDAGERRHHLDDAMIVSGLSEMPMPAEHENDLLIAHENMDTKIIIDENGKVSIATKLQDINLTSEQGNINLSTVSGLVNITDRRSSGS